MLHCSSPAFIPQHHRRAQGTGREAVEGDAEVAAVDVEGDGLCREVHQNGDAAAGLDPKIGVFIFVVVVRRSRVQCAIQSQEVEALLPEIWI